MQQITPAALAEWLAEAESSTARGTPVLLDVREPWELELAKIPGSVAIPLREIPGRSAELDEDAPIVCICHHGGRSAQAAMFLESRGFKNIFNLQTGVDGWARQIDPEMKTY
jgi:rhodanese-related sulfurtransferase